MVLGELARRNARRYPKKTAVVFENNRYTFKEFNCRVNGLANALLDMGVCKGDRIAVLLDSCHQYIEIYWAGPKAGIVVAPLNPSLTAQDLAYIINDSEANTLILGQNYVELVNSIRSNLPTIKNLIIVGTAFEGMKGYEDLISKHSSDEPSVEIDENDIAYLLYSSGTTGLPKGVMITHRQAIETALNYILVPRLTHDDITLVVLPTHWAGPLYVAILTHFYLGGTIVVLKEFNPQAALETIERERVTHIFIASPLLASLLEYPQLNKYDFKSLRRVLIGGSATPEELLKQAIATFGNIFINGYGLVEQGSLTFLLQEDMALEGPEKKKRLRSCGKEALNVRVRVVNEEEQDVPPGEVGEVISQGDNVMKGYWKMPEMTAETLRGGYLHTGDLATVDEEGYIYLMGRKKDTIISGGRSIYPTEIEEVIYHHPSIAEVAVIGVPDKELGEAIKAIVVLKGGKKATEEEIIDLCRQNLADYAIPKSVNFVTELPRNPAGKVLRRVLKEEYST